MICYKDMTFCRSDCLNRECHRHFGEKERAGAKEWWGSDEAPIAFSDFSTKCTEYQKPDKQVSLED